MDTLVAMDYHCTISIKLNIFAFIVALLHVVIDPAVFLDKRWLICSLIRFIARVLNFLWAITNSVAVELAFILNFCIFFALFHLFVTTVFRKSISTCRFLFIVALRILVHLSLEMESWSNPPIIKLLFLMRETICILSRESFINETKLISRMFIIWLIWNLFSWYLNFSFRESLFLFLVVRCLFRGPNYFFLFFIIIFLSWSSIFVVFLSRLGFILWFLVF